MLTGEQAPHRSAFILTRAASPVRAAARRPALSARGLRGRTAGEASEDRAGHQSRSAGIVVVEQPADELARRVQAGDRVLLEIEHLPGGRDPQATEREREPG